MSTEMTVVPPCSSERAVLNGDARYCVCVVCGAITRATVFARPRAPLLLDAVNAVGVPSRTPGSFR